ncbi:MAG: hypothetical protein M3176_12930 [Chloroflexota bacterium]|nr:hypothetical protein [Chloroflexota bacterium]
MQAEACSTTSTPDERALHWLLRDIGGFSLMVWPDTALRPYQIAPARAIIQSALAGDGASFAVVFARQSGKDELLAQVIAFLLIHRQLHGGEIVVAAPSLVPQGQITLRRIEERLRAAALFAPGIQTEGGHIIRVGRASARFVSAGPMAQARGATASLLLVANEAQDIEPERWDAVFDPMGASTNATTVFAGTVWTRNTLLARAMTSTEKGNEGTQHSVLSTRHCFLADWRVVAREVPAYGARVRRRMAELGEQHPFIRTEYCLQPLDDAGMLFDAAKQAQMRGAHARQRRVSLGAAGPYALLLDVAGEAEEAGAQAATGRHGFVAPRETRRDSTALTVVEIVPTDASSQTLVPRRWQRQLPGYRVVDRRIWSGVNHVLLAEEIVDLAQRVWANPACAHVVVDATGIGHGLAAMLRASLPPDTVTAFVFTAASKSDLGWRLLAAIAAGRYQEYLDDGADDTHWFWRQVAACTFTVRPGVGRQIAWSVPDPETHDDLLMSAALVGALDDHDFRDRVARGSNEQ